MEIDRIAQCINALGNFCGRRDVASLTTEDLQEKYSISKADVMVLFGGSVLQGGDVLANAMQNGVAKKYIIVGGVGHTTEALREKVHMQFPMIETANLPEAKIFAAYIRHKYNLIPDYLECESTNCGNNITYLLDLLEKERLAAKSLILCQDATMQLRMDAVLSKYKPCDMRVINYASYAATVCVKDGKLDFEESILGMWDVERYITLLMGEIPRLTDDEKGYGPIGKNFIAHVEIPEGVKFAFEQLKGEYSDLIREANPLYASREEL